MRIAVAVIVLIVWAVVADAADIGPALRETFGNEGGRQCLKSDPGNRYPDGTWGCTWYGLSPRSYPDMPKEPTMEYVARIYERDFWRPLRLNEVKSQIIANAIFDAAVNQGADTWRYQLQKGLQEVVNLSNGTGQDIVVDGQIGPRTIALINSVDQVDLYVNLIGLQWERYHLIVRKNPRMKEWYRGWMKRVARTVTKAVHDRDGG